MRSPYYDLLSHLYTLQVGRYWPKEEKRRHLEQAKERKKKQMALIQAKNEVTRKKVGENATIPTQVTAKNHQFSKNSSMIMKRSQSVEPVLLSVTTV